jgi:hypothetical protein
MKAVALGTVCSAIAICLLPMVGMAQTFTPTFEQGVARVGGNYRTLESGPDPKSCQDSCIADPQCRAWTFNDWKPHCNLKDRVPLPAISSHLWSGVVRPEP